jgi:hypothetical protein
MRLIRMVALFLLLVAPAHVAMAPVEVRQVDVVVARGENDPLDAPLSPDLGARLLP